LREAPVADDLTRQRLAAIIEFSDDAIVSKTLDGIVTSWNPAAERIFGYRAEEMIGASITRIFPPDRLSEEEEFLARLRRGERIEHFQTTRRTKDGRFINISVTLSPIMDETGRIVGASKIARDITSRVQDQAAAERQQRLLAVTLSSIGDGVVATDNFGKITFMNPTAEALTGWSGAEALGMPLDSVMTLLNEKTRERADNPVGLVLSEGHIVGLANHTVLVGKDGREHPIDDSAAPIHDEHGNVFGVVMVFHDVSERRRQQEELLRLAAIVESTDDAVITKTLGGIITTWNEAAERIFGYTAEEAIGRSITLLFPPERIGEEAEFMRRLAAGERIDHFQTERIRKDGARLHMSVTQSALKNEAGEIFGISKIARDITEQVALMRREQAARRDAEEANRVKDEFLATLSHELRTPLNAIFGWVRMLRMGALDPEAANRALEVIERNCKAQTDLISDLLDVSRIVTGRLTVEPRPIDFRTPVQAAVDAVRPSALAKGIDLSLQYAPEALVIPGDSDRLQQVFWNLLNNAVKFTGRGGRISVTVERAPSGVQGTVTDNGVGIAPEVLPHIFERFRQGDSSLGRPYSGLGIGLALVRHLVDLHGGTVDVRSAGEGKGASFIVRLPLMAIAARPGAADIFSGISRPFPRLDDLRILVVEDESEARDLVTEVLERCGATVTTADSAPSALLLLREDRPHVLISDIGMPELDGYEFIRRVRQMESMSGDSTPAIALTAYAGTEDRKRALEAGFHLHLAKPVDPLELVLAVARFGHRNSMPATEPR
jgi:PAS domain S-box-containing protein